MSRIGLAFVIRSRVVNPGKRFVNRDQAILLPDLARTLPAWRGSLP